MARKEDLIDNLLGKSTVKRRKAAIEARKFTNGICINVINALQIELGSKNWQTQVELVITLGILECTKSAIILKELIFSNKPTDFGAVKICAATALVRVLRSDLTDIDAIRKVTDDGDYLVVEGALEAIGYDKMLFDDETCATLLRDFWDFGKDREKGFGDPRYGLAAACAGWSNNICAEFLNHCLDSNDTPLIYVAKNSLNNHYVKLR